MKFSGITLQIGFHRLLCDLRFNLLFLDTMQKQLSSYLGQSVTLYYKLPKFKIRMGWSGYMRIKQKMIHDKRWGSGSIGPSSEIHIRRKLN